MTLSNVTSGIVQAGISPYKTVIFTDDDTAAAFVTNTLGSNFSQKNKIKRKSKRF
jgi:hypothetical protein